jgi:glycosyltransferase involved in cell wall biosynthesis/SAM-dependent methyltransferase
VIPGLVSPAVPRQRERAEADLDRTAPPIGGAVRRGQARIAICNWRDLAHPEGGGSELYVEELARSLASLGNEVTLLCASVDGAPADEVRAGVRYRRRGGRLTVYLHAALALLCRTVKADVVVDVQNGVPWLTPAVRRGPSVTLVHHVHREQWTIAMRGVASRLGWWLESRFAPWLYRHRQYVTVSRSSAEELADLGIAPARTRVIYNGTPELPAPRVGKSPTPRVVVLGRLVPHKRVEIVLRAAAELRLSHPDLVVDVVGEGWWHEQLTAEAERLDVSDRVRFHGRVDEQTKSDLLAAAWVHAAPSVKEGWGLTVMEAATVATPTVGFAGAGGLGESIVDGMTGVLVDGGQSEWTAALAALLDDRERRMALGRAAAGRAELYTWKHSASRWVAVLDEVLQVPTQPFRADLARSRKLFQDFRHEQDDPDRFYNALSQDSVAQIEQWVTLPDRTVVDVGGGPGYFRDEFHRRGATYVVVDPDPREIYARGGASGLTVFGDGMQLPLATASVDIAFSSNALEHVPRPEELADEMVRITKAAGLIYLSYTNWLSPNGGHETKPWHLIVGGQRAADRYARRVGHRPKNDFGQSLFPISVARMLRWADAVVASGEVEKVAVLPRYHPSWAQPIIKIPGLREYACWNVLLVLRKRP